MEIFEPLVIAGFFCFIIGAYLTRLYYQRTVRDVSLGKIIEVSLIDTKIKELESQIKVLNNTILNLKEIGEALEEQVINSQDIEKSLSGKFETQDQIEIEDIKESEA